LHASSSLSGVSAVLGGSLWTLHTILLAVRPAGCVGQACFEGVGRHRESEDAAWVLLVSVLLLAVSMAAAPRRAGRRDALLTASLLLLALGAVLLALGLLVNGAFPSGSPLWWLHDSDALGRLVPVLGTLVAGIAMLRSGAPRWEPSLFIAAAVASLAVNVQDERVLLGLPVGVAWAALGAHVLLSTRRSDAPSPGGRAADGRAPGRGAPER
jgi:hypothetical protein